MTQKENKVRALRAQVIHVVKWVSWKFFKRAMRFDALETYENRTVELSYYDTTEHLTSAVLPCTFCVR